MNDLTDIPKFVDTELRHNYNQAPMLAVHFPDSRWTSINVHFVCKSAVLFYLMNSSYNHKIAYYGDVSVTSS